jgi:hypothetical protein
VTEAAGFFLEDTGHKALIVPLVRRLAVEIGVGVRPDVRRSTGGAGAVLKELQTYLRDLAKGRPSGHSLVVVGIDANCKGFNAKRREVADRLSVAPVPHSVACIPDPHVEKWYLLDPVAVDKVGGKMPGSLDLDRCGKREKQFYKDTLRRAFLSEDGSPGIVTEADIGEPLAQEMDIDRCCDRDAAFKAFIEDTRAVLKRMKGAVG